MAEFKIEKDMTGALKKTQALANVPKAFKKTVTAWAADSVKELKRSASDMKKSGPGRKTGQLARSVGMKVTGDAEKSMSVAVGTGVGGTLASKYAKIQDEGGTIKPKNKKYLAIPLPGTKGVPANFPDAFIIKSKKGNLLIVQRKWKKVRGGENSRQTNNLELLFALKKEVTLPATQWFSRPMRQRLAYLEAMTTPERIYEEAEKMTMTGTGTPRQVD